jgi:hypothetical protein
MTRAGKQDVHHIRARAQQSQMVTKRRQYDDRDYLPASLTCLLIGQAVVEGSGENRAFNDITQDVVRLNDQPVVVARRRRMLAVECNSCIRLPVF